MIKISNKKNKSLYKNNSGLKQDVVDGFLEGSNPQNLQQSANNRVAITQQKNPRKLNYQKAINKSKRITSSLNSLKLNSGSASQEVLRLKELALSSYTRALCAPEYARDAKIPALFPLPTNSVHMKTTIKFTTNSLGNAAILINPWYLNDSTSATKYSWIMINNDTGLTLQTGQTLTNNFVAYDMGSRISSSDATAARLVSASMHLYPEMSMQTAQGYIAGGIVTRSQQTTSYQVGSTGNNPFGGNAALSSVIDQALYYQKAQIGSQAGVRALYMPFDPTFEVFLSIGASRAGLTSNIDNFFWNYYVTGTQANANMVLDIYYNWEVEPAQESVLELFTTQHQPSESTAPAVKLLATNPSLVAQSSSNLLGLAKEIDDAVITGKQPSVLDQTINWVSNNSGNILNVVKAIAPLFL